MSNLEAVLIGMIIGHIISAIKLTGGSDENI